MDIETRVALLEAGAKQRHADNEKLRAAIADLTDHVRELNKWQASMKYPLTALGMFFVGILSAAGYGVWSLFTKGVQ
jgi:hypothetical protein